MSRAVEIAIERGEFMTGEDGFVQWWPSCNGYVTAQNLRDLAGELDRRNAAWAEQIAREIGG